MPTRILMASQLSDAVMDVAREILPPGYELIVAEFDSAEFAAALKDAEYYVGSPRFPLGPEFYRAAPRLKLVQLFSAGYDRLDLAAAHEGALAAVDRDEPFLAEPRDGLPDGGAAHPEPPHQLELGRDPLVGLEPAGHDLLPEDLEELLVQRHRAPPLDGRGLALRAGRRGRAAWSGPVRAFAGHRAPAGVK